MTYLLFYVTGASLCVEHGAEAPSPFPFRSDRPDGNRGKSAKKVQQFQNIDDFMKIVPKIDYFVKIVPKSRRRYGT